MRLALIGPSKGNLKALRSRAEFVLDELHADRAVYLGVDGALDELVGKWATDLVGGAPDDGAVWTRAAQLSRADPEQIDAFLKAERRRQQLKTLECLPSATARSVELFDSVVTVLIFDKALLDEEDMLPASVMVFGRSAEPVIHKVGVRSFVSPGPVSHSAGGIAMLRDEGDDVWASIYGPQGKCLQEMIVASTARMAKMTVQGAPG